MLCTLYVELCISELTSIETAIEDIINEKLTEHKKDQMQKLTIERQKATERFKNFLIDYEGDLEQETIFELLNAHGRSKDTLQIAHDKGNHEFIIKYYIDNAEYECALKAIVNVKDEKKKKLLMTQYLCILVANLPEKTFEVLANDFSLINITGIIPSLLKIDKKSCKLLLEYLKGIKDKTEDKFLHNMYLFLLVMNKDTKEELLDYIIDQERKQRAAQASLIDIEFALHVCKHFNQNEALIHTYAMHEYYEEAVKLAIKLNKLELAETYANSATDNFIKKALWTEIAKKNLVEEQANINALTKCRLLSLVDIFPFIPPTVKLNLFHENLKNTLNEHHKKIDKTYNQAREYGRIFQRMYKKTSWFINKSIQVHANQLCAICNRPLLGSERIFVFPCSHGFHMVCY